MTGTNCVEAVALRPGSAPSFRRPDSSFPYGQTTYPSVPTMITPALAMIRAVLMSSAGSRPSSTGRRSKPAPVPTIVREASGKRASYLSGVRRG